MSQYQPVLVRGAAAAATPLSEWSHEAMLHRCNRKDGTPWSVTIERNNRVSHNDRWPLVSGWNFCQYLEAYRKPENKNMLYCISSISDDGLSFVEHLKMPKMLDCAEFGTSLHDVRMWMSSGNTTSSQHFDTHENLLMQIDGEKRIFLSHPNESQYFYMDHHDKYGLSPINVDRVDLQRFPRLPEAKVLYAHLYPGDALYIPDCYWHVIHSTTGRNIGLAFEWGAFSSSVGRYPTELLKLFDHPGLYWAERTRLEGSMRQRDAAWTPSQQTRRPIKCTAPMESLRNLSEYTHWRLH